MEQYAGRMNGVGTGNSYRAGGGVLSPAMNVDTTGRPLVDSYKNDFLSRVDTEQSGYNSMDPQESNGSTLADLKDPIQVHLLTETALTDSKNYEILAQEEVDSLKKQVQSLSVRIEQTRANLAIQTKYRDAAVSMSKLFAPGSQRHSLLDNRASVDFSAKEAELERRVSEQRCEELATELYSLEKRMMAPERRLLQHTAAILQMTHRASSKKNASTPQGLPPNGIPGSPESLYTQTNGRNSMDHVGDDAYRDNWDLYQPTTGGPTSRSMEIPLKSPIREQNSQLREEADQLKEKVQQLQEAEMRLKTESESARQENLDRQRTIRDTQAQLEVLNAQIREVIVKFDRARNQNYSQPPTSSPSLAQQLEYLKMGLATVAEEQDLLDEQASQNARNADSAAVEIREATEAVAQAEARAANLAANLDRAEQRATELNRRIRQALENSSAEQARPADLADSSLDNQLEYLGASLQVVESELAKAAQLSMSMSANKQSIEQVETILTGLWDIIQSGFAVIQQQRAERRRARSAKGLSEDEDDLSGDESFNTSEPYTLSAFSTRVQWLYAQATSLKEEKVILKRQIRQQRELNNKSGSDKDLELKARLDELDSVKGQLAAYEKGSREAQAQLAERETKLAALEASSQDAESRFAAADARLDKLKGELAQASEAQAIAAASLEKLEREAKEKDDELERLNVMVIELKTEATIAKAELDGAYGSRAQRAADVAKLSKTSETAGLNAQVEELKAELASTLQEFESMTKETLAAEREKLELEAQLDDAVAARAALQAEVRDLKDKRETEISKLKEQLDAERLRVPPSPGIGQGSRAGATMLSEQFRATMKEERKKFQDELREEQARRRKLEDDLRALRKSAGPGRSPLSPN